MQLVATGLVCSFLAIAWHKPLTWSHLPHMPSLLMLIVSTAAWHCAIWSAFDLAVMVFACAMVCCCCFTAAVVFASRSLFACWASQAPILRPAMVMVMSPCFDGILNVQLYSVCAAM